MSRFQLGLMASAVILFTACSPKVWVHSVPRGPRIQASCIKVGETLLVNLSIPRKEGAPSWTAEFIGDSPADLTIEDIPGLTIIRWRMSQDRMQSPSIRPYELNLKNNGSTHLTRVAFRGSAQLFARDLIAATVVH